MIYSKILYHVRQSTRRVASNPTGRSMSLHASAHSIERSGSPFLILTLWNIIKPESSPKQFYILSLNSILLCSTILTSVLFFTNKKVKDILFKH
jgi:hypothetical protein